MVRNEKVSQPISSPTVQVPTSCQNFERRPTKTKKMKDERMELFKPLASYWKRLLRQQSYICCCFRNASNLRSSDTEKHLRSIPAFPLFKSRQNAWEDRLVSVLTIGLKLSHGTVCTLCKWSFSELTLSSIVHRFISLLILLVWWSDFSRCKASSGTRQEWHLHWDEVSGRWSCWRY